MNRAPDDDLRELLGGARRAEEEKAPPFRRVLEGRAGRRVTKRPRIGWAVVAAAGAVVFAISIWTRHPRQAQAGRIEAWKPATEFLLKASSSAVFDTLPALPRPVPDYSLVLAQEKGSQL